MITIQQYTPNIVRPQYWGVRLSVFRVIGRRLCSWGRGVGFRLRVELFGFDVVVAVCRPRGELGT